MAALKIVASLLLLVFSYSLGAVLASRRGERVTYMLMVLPVQEDQRSRIPAVTYVNGSARPQTIRREWNPHYYDVIQRFSSESGVPVLLNTSFNLRGEPIVNTPQNALNTYSKSNIDSLYIGSYLVNRS
jgi:carbamoyltransferase